MAYRILFRRDTAANWSTNNPVLASGEPGYETDSGKMKVGDGTTAWSSLDYYGVQFTTPQVGNPVVGYTGSTNSSNYKTVATKLDPTKNVIYIDTTGWNANTSYLNYYLPASDVDGHKVEFVLNPSGSNLSRNPNKINIWMDTLRDPSRYGSTGATGSTGSSSFWNAFSRYDSTTSWRPDNPSGIWIDGYWTIDNGQWNN